MDFMQNPPYNIVHSIIAKNAAKNNLFLKIVFCFYFIAFYIAEWYNM